MVLDFVPVVLSVEKNIDVIDVADEDEMKSYWILIKMEDLFSLKEYNILINTSVRMLRQAKVPVCQSSDG